MAATSETFNFAYGLVGDPQNGFTLKDNNTDTKKPVDPVAATVKVEDPNGGHISSGQNIHVTSEGTVFNPEFGPGTDYVFVAQANVKDHGTTISGIIIENTTTHQYILLTDQEYTGKLGGKNGDVTITSY